MNWKNGNFDIFKYQENEYKITVLYLLKEVSLDVKELILNLVDINLEQELNYFDLSSQENLEMDSPSQNYLNWFYDSDWYQSD